MWLRHLRRRIFQASIVLAGLAVWGSVTALQAPEMATERLFSIDEGFFETKRDLHLPCVSEADFEVFRRNLIRFHGSDSDEQPAGDALPVAPSVLPLRAYRVSFYGHRPDAPDYLELVPKDPAFKERLKLMEGSVTAVGEFRSVVVSDTQARLLVVRGEERWTFVQPWKMQQRGRAVRLLDARQPPVGAAPTPGAAPHAPEQVQPALPMKFVPFYEGSQVIGARVTGVKPGSWAARRGLLPGDVLASVDSKSVQSLRHAREMLGERNEPKSLSIKRLTNGTLVAIDL